MKRSLNILKHLFVIALVVFLYSFTSQRNMARTIDKIDIEFMDQSLPFVSLDTVNKLLIQSLDNSTSINKETLDLKEMENRLRKNPMIRDAQVYLSVDGVLGAKIEQRIPIARVAGSSGFYLDEDGMKMPLSKMYSARVPLISGKSNLKLEKVTELFTKINRDPFMKNSVVGVHVLAGDNILLQLRKQEFTIHLGKIEKVEKKFQNYKAFYQKSKQDSTLGEYKRVNLEYLSQVVATKL